MNVAGFLVPSGAAGFVATLLDVLFLALLAPSVEGRLGHAIVLAIAFAGSLLALALRSLIGSGGLAPLPFAAAGATVAVLLTYLVVFPRGRVFTLVLIPFLVTIIEVPAALLLGFWLVAQISLGMAG